MEDDDHRSGCPINLSLEVFGDKWSLLILRDMMFGDKRHFCELLRSEEGIYSNILADRLRKLLGEGMITRRTTRATSRRRSTPSSRSPSPSYRSSRIWGRGAEGTFRRAKSRACERGCWRRAVPR